MRLVPEMRDLILKGFKEVERRRHEVIETCRELIRIDTTNNPSLKVGKERRGQEYIARKLKEIGFPTIDSFEPDEGKLKDLRGYVPAPDWTGRYAGRENVVGTIGGEAGKSIILNGHIDTVTAGPKELWQHNPHGGELDGGKIYGRGAADMKSGMAALLMATKCANEVGGIKGKVIVESVVDEEGGGNGSLACSAKGYSADAAIVAEPTRLRICTAHRGVLIARIEIIGKAAHASRKEEGVSALEKGVEILRQLSLLEQYRREHVDLHPLLEKPTILAGKFQAGDQVNVVPPKCTIDIDVKYLPSEVDDLGGGSRVKEQLEKWVLEASEKDPWLKEHPPKIDFLYDLPPSSTPVDHQLVSTINSVYADLFGGQTAKIVGFQAWSDMYHLNSTKTPAVMCGPGDMDESAHQIDEYVEVDELIDATKLLCGVIIAWCN
jgi:acetylornithine deacetylase